MRVQGWSGCAALLLAVALSGCGKPSAKADDARASVQVVTAAPPRDDAPILATGALKREREMVLSFRIPGVITRLGVDDGDAVRKGQTIASLDPTAVAARLRQTEADLARARSDARRLEGLVERGAISRQQLEAQQTAVADAQSAYDQAAFDRRWANLTAPADGVVLQRSAQTGEVVQPGQAVVTLADQTSNLVLRAPLSDRDIVRVRLGAPAAVRLDAAPGEVLTGRVSRIGERAGAASGAIEVEVTLPPRPGLRSGLIARAEITAKPTAARSDFVRVPAEAVLEANGPKASVMLYDAPAGRARRQSITFGGFDGDDALVAGLPNGARVITMGAGYVVDGDPVRVVDAAALTASPAASR